MEEGGWEEEEVEEEVEEGDMNFVPLPMLITRRLSVRESCKI